MRGKLLVQHMAPGDLCLITVTTCGNVDTIGRIGPEQFPGKFKGVVRSVQGDMCEAVFADHRITQHPDMEIACLDDREPPFVYSVQPRYRMQGLTGFTEFIPGQHCVIHIDDFERDKLLLENPGLSPEEVLECFPTDLVGIWEAVVIYSVSQGIKREGASDVYPIAVVLVDERIREHENPAVQAWFKREPPVRYNAYCVNDTILTAARHVLGFWKSVRDSIMLSWPGIDNNLLH